MGIGKIIVKYVFFGWIFGYGKEDTAKTSKDAKAIITEKEKLIDDGTGKKEAEKIINEGDKEDITKGSEERKEEAIVKDAGAKAIEEDLEHVEKVEEKVGDDAEKTKKEAVSDEKSGFKKSHDGHKEKGKVGKEKKIVIKKEGEEVEDSSNIIGYIGDATKDIIIGVAATKIVIEKTGKAVTAELKSEIQSEALKSNVNQLARQLGAYANFNQINNYTIDWIKRVFFVQVFNSFENKVRLVDYQNKLNDSLLPNTRSAIQAAKVSTKRLDNAEDKLESLMGHEGKDHKKAIKNLNKLIKNKVKALSKIRKKAKKQGDKALADDLLREEQLLSQHKTRLNQTRDKIKVSVKQVKKQLDLSGDIISKLRVQESNLDQFEGQLEQKSLSINGLLQHMKTHEIKYVKETVEKIYTQPDITPEEIFQRSQVEIRTFFEKYYLLLDGLSDFKHLLLAIINLSIRVIYNERALLFLLDGIDKGQDAIDKGGQAITDQSASIMELDQVTKDDLRKFSAQLTLIEQGLEKIDDDIKKLQNAAKYIGNEAASVKQVIEKDISEVARIKGLAEQEAAAITWAINAAAAKFVDRRSNIDRKILKVENERYINALDKEQKQQETLTTEAKREAA